MREESGFLVNQAQENEINIEIMLAIAICVCEAHIHMRSSSYSLIPQLYVYASFRIRNSHRYAKEFQDHFENEEASDELSVFLYSGIDNR